MAVIITGSNTPTAGGVTYGDGTTYANTAAGTSGQVLTSAGASAPTWATVSAGALIKISTQTASSSASLEWTGLSGYDQYYLVFSNLVASASHTNIYLLLGTGSTPTYSTSNWSIAAIRGSGATITGTSTATTAGQGWIAAWPASGAYTGAGNAVISGMNAAVAGSISNFYAMDSNPLGTAKSHFVTGGLPITAIKFGQSTGNMTSGSATLYGITS